MSCNVEVSPYALCCLAPPQKCNVEIEQEPKSAPSSWIQEMEKYSSGKIWLAPFFLISVYTFHPLSSRLLLPITALASVCLFQNKTLFHSILFGLFPIFSIRFFI